MNNQRIAYIVAVVIVNILKAVEIDKHHALRLVLRVFAYLIKTFDQRPPVWQAAQPVGHGNIARQLFAARQLVKPEAAEENKQQDQPRCHDGDQPNIV